MPTLTRGDFGITLIGAATASALPAQAAEELASLPLAEASGRIRGRAVTSVQLTQACLARIATYNPKLNAFITVLREQALGQARDLDAEQRAGKLRGPVHGIPI